MPMTWTPENDRILLLKVIETQGLSISPAACQKIVAAWPSDAPSKPSPRAITERFVKLRQLAGMTAGGTPIGSRAPRTPSSKAAVTPTSTAKKRKTQKKDTEGDESDGEDHLTPSEDETPSKTRKMTRSKSGGRAKSGSGMLGGRGMLNGTPTKTKVKDEPIELENRFERSTEFANDAAKASQLRRLNSRTPTMGMTNDFYDFDTNLDNGNDLLTGFGNTMGGLDMHNTLPMHYGQGNGLDGMSFDNINLSTSTGIFDPLAHTTPNLHFGQSFSPSRGGSVTMKKPQPMTLSTRSPAATKKSVPTAASMHASVASSEASTIGADSIGRARSSRKASAGIAEFTRLLKEQDRENGEASSVEDSQASEWQGESEPEYV